MTDLTIAKIAQKNPRLSGDFEPASLLAAQLKFSYNEYGAALTRQRHKWL